MSNTSMTYVEFDISFPIFTLSDEEDEGESTNCAEISAICDLLGIALPNQSLEDLYFYGDPTTKCGPGDLFVFLANADDQCFLFLEMSDERTMCMARCGVRCGPSHTSTIAGFLRSLHGRSEILTAFLQGNLGLPELLDLSKYPRRVDNEGKPVIQHIAIYRNGILQATSRRR